MNTAGTVFYWASAGAIMGFGIATAFSIGLPLVILGIFFMSYKLAKGERRGLWAALVGFGAVPAGLLLYNYLAADTPKAYMPDNTVIILALFAAIAVAGMIWGMLEVIQIRRFARNQGDHKGRPYG